MKLRKGFIAAATAAAMVTGGMAAAPAQAAEPTVRVLAADDTTPAKDSGMSSNAGSSSDGVKNVDPKVISSWLSVVTGIIGVVAAIAGVVSKYIMK